MSFKKSQKLLLGLFIALMVFMSCEISKQNVPKEENYNKAINGNKVVNLPAKTFVEYDIPPKPIGGAKAIMANVVYPKKAREAGIEGTVIIQTFVNKQGVVSECEVGKGIANTGLDKAAIKALKNTKFTPAEMGGEAIGVWIAVPIVFHLEEGESK